MCCFLQTISTDVSVRIPFNRGTRRPAPLASCLTHQQLQRIGHWGSQPPTWARTEAPVLERRHETPAPSRRRPSRQPCRSSHSGRHVRQASPGACTLTWLLLTRSGRQRHEAARLRRCTAARGRPRLRDPSLQQCRLQAADSLARRACRRQPSPCRRNPGRSSQCAARLTEVSLTSSPAWRPSRHHPIEDHVSSMPSHVLVIIAET